VVDGQDAHDEVVDAEAVDAEVAVVESDVDDDDDGGGGGSTNPQAAARLLPQLSPLLLRWRWCGGDSSSSSSCRWR